MKMSPTNIFNTLQQMCDPCIASLLIHLLSSVAFHKPFISISQIFTTGGFQSKTSPQDPEWSWKMYITQYGKKRKGSSWALSVTWPKSSFQPNYYSSSEERLQEYEIIPGTFTSSKEAMKPESWLKTKDKEASKQTSKPHSISLFRRGADECS